MPSTDDRSPADDLPDTGGSDPTRHEAGFVAHLRRTWRSWLFGLVCAIGLGIFMWAVDGRVNVQAPEPQGIATTPVEAVEKFLAAVDRHDADAARSYAGDEFDPHVEDWIDRAGYVRLLAADEATTGVDATDATEPDVGVGVSDTAMAPGSVTLDVTYEAATGFLDDDDPLGLNLAVLVWTEEAEHPFVVTPAGDGWVVVDAGPPLRK